MATPLLSFYVFMKLIYFYSLVKIQIKFENMQDHYLFLGILYSGGIAILSYVFLLSYQENPDLRAWGIWLAKNFALSTFYFWLMSKFDSGVMFWTLLILGLGVVWF
jgi:hypothetical protein